jgi:hypothetical protein
MSKLPVVSGADCIKALTKIGFDVVSSWVQLNIKCLWYGHLARQQARSLFHYLTIN